VEEIDGDESGCCERVVGAALEGLASDLQDRLDDEL
jgi:hypothetical protein